MSLKPNHRSCRALVWLIRGINREGATHMTIKLTRLDLDYILTQIQMAEAGQIPVNPLLSFGLRTVDGVNNNLSAGGATFGSSFQPFPTVTDPLLQNAQGGTSYSQTIGLVIDAQPRQISLMIANSGIKSWRLALDGIYGTADDVVQANAAALAAQARAFSHLGAGYRTPRCPARTASTGRPTTRLGSTRVPMG